MKRAGTGHLHGLQPVEVGPARLHIGIGVLVDSADDVPFGGDEVGDSGPVPRLRLGAPEDEAQHVHFAGRLPLQEHRLPLGGGGEGDQGDGSPDQDGQQEDQQKGKKPPPERAKESDGPLESPAEGPVEGTVGDRDNPAPALHPQRSPQQGLRRPGRVGREVGVPLGEEPPLRSAAQEAVEEHPAAVPAEHHIAGTKVIRPRRFHPHHIAGAKDGEHAPSPHPYP